MIIRQIIGLIILITILLVLNSNKSMPSGKGENGHGIFKTK